MNDIIKKRLTCISCPMGCLLEVTVNDGKIDVKGNACPKGKEYATTEMTAPKRVVTTCIAVCGGKISVVSVKSSQPIDKGKVFDCLREIKKTHLSAPVGFGITVIKDILNSGADIITTKEVPQKSTSGA